MNSKNMGSEIGLIMGFHRNTRWLEHHLSARQVCTMQKTSGAPVSTIALHGSILA